MKIDITLADRDVGTTATVTQTRFFRTTQRRYVCARADPWGGGRWIDAETGAPADMDLEYRLNDTAQGAASLMRLGLR